MFTRVRPQSIICFCLSTANPNTSHFSLGTQSVLDLEGFAERCRAPLSSHTPLVFSLHAGGRVAVFLSVAHSMLQSVLKSQIVSFPPAFTLHVLPHMFPLEGALYISNHHIQPLIFSSVVFASSVLTQPQFPLSI